MFWVIHDCLYKEQGHEELLATLEKFDVPHQVVAVARDGTLTPEVSPTGAVFVCGAYSLARVAQARGWHPGTFLNDNHHHAAWTRAYGGQLLNADGVVMRLGDAFSPDEQFFIRPVEDTKSFPGQIMENLNLDSWRRDLIASARGSSPPVADTLVVVAPRRTVFREVRTFVVDGAVVAWSTYKAGNRMLASPDVEPDALDFARRMTALWQPARAFVLDVALTEGGVWKVVEVNNVNSAGFYAADVQRIVMAIESMGYDDAPTSVLTAPDALT